MEELSDALMTLSDSMRLQVTILFVIGILIILSIIYLTILKKAKSKK